MNIFLWILQIILALYNIAGGVYLTFNYAKVTNHFAYTTFPQPFWTALGILQILLAVGLVIPWKKGNLHNLNAVSAGCLAVLLLLGDLFYVAYAGFPGMLWGVIPALFAAFVAYKRIGK